MHLPTGFFVQERSGIIPAMPKDDQRRDARLLSAMKAPPLSREELRAELKRAREAKKAEKSA
jgi:hypothetical protein